MPVHHNTCKCRSCGCSDAKRVKSERVTYGFQVGDSLTRCVPGLRAQQTLLFEYEAGSDEDTANYGENDANDLDGVTTGGQRWGGG
jgi:hypothetical protein